MMLFFAALLPSSNNTHFLGLPFKSQHFGINEKPFVLKAKSFFGKAKVFVVTAMPSAFKTINVDLKTQAESRSTKALDLKTTGFALIASCFALKTKCYARKPTACVFKTKRIHNKEILLKEMTIALYALAAFSEIVSVSLT